MRTALLLAACLIPLAMPVGASGPDVRISEILPNPTDREFIELHNAGGAPAALQGFTIRDAANNTYTFGNHTLPAGARIVVWGGGSDDATGPAWSKASVWNNGGDTATLRDASGTVLDSMSYGTDPAAPAQGSSLERINGQWVEGAPTPGTAPGGGTVQATVQDVAPTITWNPSNHVRAGSNVTFRFTVQDANGDAVAWSLEDTGVLASGSDGTHNVTVAAPAAEQAWALSLQATDPAGNVAFENHTVHVRASDLIVDFPHGNVAFPAFSPGAQNITSTAFTIQNVAPHAIAPRIDVSDFTGPASIPVASNMTLLVDGAPVAYTGALTPLPALPSGHTAQVQLRLDGVPEVLPAGSYGTSFTVVA